MRSKRHNVVQHDSPKEAIRNAAAKLFAEKGFAATSTREICEQAGVTKPVLYYHFGNKEQLYEELVLDTFNEYQKELRRASRRARTAPEKLTEILSAMFSYARHRHDYWRMGFRMVFAPEKESPNIDLVEMSRADERLLTEVVREGIRKGEMKGKPDKIAGAIVGMTTIHIMSFLLTGRPPLDRTVARDVINLLMRGCGRAATER
jgi:TetR/AcrR family transcriptional regulator